MMETQKKRRFDRPETYSDMIPRLFPDSRDGMLRVGGNHVRDITLQVTEDCNLRCTYCYQHDKTPKHMSFETGKKFIDIILESDERSAKYIQSRECAGVVFNFIGGEPLLEIDLISDLTDYTIQRMIELDHPWLFRHMFGICTNGLLYFEPKVQEYLKKHHSHLSLTVTVDGNKEIHDTCRLDIAGNGSYDRAIAAANHWYSTYNKAGSAFPTKITISPQNLPKIGDAVIEFVDNESTDININCVYENVWNIDHARMLYRELKKIADHLLATDMQDDVRIGILTDPTGRPYTNHNTWCGGNGLMIAVDPAGDIYPCLRYAPSSVGPTVEKFKIGDVDHGFIYDEVQTERLRCLSCITRQSQCEKTEHCLDCKIGEGCGDCAAYSYEVFGEVGHRTTFICDMHKARVLAQLYFKNLSHIKTGLRDPMPNNMPNEWALQIIDEDEWNMIKSIVNESMSKE